MSSNVVTSLPSLPGIDSGQLAQLLESPREGVLAPAMGDPERGSSDDEGPSAATAEGIRHNIRSALSTDIWNPRSGTRAQHTAKKRNKKRRKKRKKRTKKAAGVVRQQARTLQLGLRHQGEMEGESDFFEHDHARSQSASTMHRDRGAGPTGDRASARSASASGFLRDSAEEDAVDDVDVAWEPQPSMLRQRLLHAQRLASGLSQQLRLQHVG